MTLGFPPRSGIPILTGSSPYSKVKGLKPVLKLVVDLIVHKAIGTRSGHVLWLSEMYTDTKFSRVLCIRSTLAVPVGILPVVKVCLQATRRVISGNTSDRNVAPLSECNLSTFPYRHIMPYKNTSAAVFAVESFVQYASGHPVSRSINDIMYLDPSFAVFSGPIKSHCTTSHGRVGASHDRASAL